MHKTKHFKNRKTEGKTVNFKPNPVHAVNVVLPPPAYTPPLADNTMEVEEHFAFKATCDHEDQDMYNVYPAGTTSLKDKTEDDLKRIEYEISDSEDSESEVSEPEDSDSVLGSPQLCYDSLDDDLSLTPQLKRVPLGHLGG